VRNKDPALSTSNNIPTWLQQQLEIREWSKSDFARKLGVPSARVSEWFAGRQRPSPQTCAKFAEVLGVDLDTVLAAAGHRPAPVPLDGPKADLIALIQRADLSSDMISALTALVRDFMRSRESAG
jgi:transcriptional regulator with XRE-family HTH domain